MNSNARLKTGNRSVVPCRSLQLNDSVSVVRLKPGLPTKRISSSEWEAGHPHRSGAVPPPPKVGRTLRVSRRTNRLSGTHRPIIGKRKVAGRRLGGPANHCSAPDGPPSSRATTCHNTASAQDQKKRPGFSGAAWSDEWALRTHNARNCATSLHGPMPLRPITRMRP